MRLTALSAFADNYIWTLIGDDGAAVVVDPGDAARYSHWPIRACAWTRSCSPTTTTTIIGGVPALQARFPGVRVVAPVEERIASATERVGEGEHVQALGQMFHVLSVPGHTRSHIAFHTAEHLFSGDSLFSLGCGRLFEGTPSQLLASMRKLGALPAQLLLCCAHEYTVSNAVFARHVDLRQRCPVAAPRGGFGHAPR